MRPSLLVLAILTLGACRAARAPVAAALPAPLTASAPPADAVVATVDGRPIRASEVALQAQASKVAPRQALEQLIDAEVLAGEAARRGLGARLEVQLATHQAEVRRLLAETFEHDVTPASIPARLVERGYQRNRKLFDHGEEVEVCHIVMLADDKSTAAERAAARAAAEAVEAKAKTARTLEDFEALAKLPQSSGVKDKVEQFVFENPGGMVKEFADAAFALRRPGDLSPVIETRYGYHVIRLIRRIAATHLGLAAAAPAVRQKLFPSYRQQAFKQWLQAVSSSHVIEQHPERITGS